MRGQQGGGVDRPAQWRSQMDRTGSSAVGAAWVALCKTESVSAGSFHYWRRKPAADSGKTSDLADSRPAGFVDVGMTRLTGAGRFVAPDEAAPTTGLESRHPGTGPSRGKKRTPTVSVESREIWNLRIWTTEPIFNRLVIC